MAKLVPMRVQTGGNEALIFSRLNRRGRRIPVFTIISDSSIASELQFHIILFSFHLFHSEFFILFTSELLTYFISLLFRLSRGMRRTVSEQTLHTFREHADGSNVGIK